MPKIIQGKFKIVSNRKTGPNYYKMVICAPAIAKGALPGQFVHLRCRDSAEPLLRRPFSFHYLNKNNFEILYKVIGQGTHLLTKRKKGEKIDILGPLGNGFNFTRGTKQEVPSAIIVAGGMGAAPLLALAEKMANRKNMPVLLGAKTEKDIICERDFKKLGAKVQVATDDGSCGRKGLVSDLLNDFLRSAKNEARRTIYACGPKPMLKEIAHISNRFNISAYASLEENMACGVGACLGCAVNTKEGYKQVCKDGPVFNLKDIKW